MSKSQLYIGTDLLDFNAKVNIKRQVNDYRNTDIGSIVTSYTIEIPLTKTNRAALGFPEDVRSRVEVSDIARLVINHMEVIRGRLKILSATPGSVRAIIEGKDWLDDVAGLLLPDLPGWTSAYNFTHTKTAIETTWDNLAGRWCRYPLINFAELRTGDSGQSGSRLGIWDLYPAFNVQDTVARIIADAGYALDTSGFFNTVYGHSLYLLAKPVVAEDAFIGDRDMKAYVTNDTDNEDTETVLAGASFTLNMSNQRLVLSSEDVDEGGDFSTSTYLYTVPETGTYRFQLRVEVYSTANDDINYSVSANNLTITIRKTTGINLRSASYGGVTIFDTPNEFEIDTSYAHLDAGDTIEVRFSASVSATNNYSISKDPTLYIKSGVDVSYFQNVMDQACLWLGNNKVVTPAEYMPEIEAVDFLKALKQAFNLRFWVDRLNKKVYCETADEFYGDDVIDWSDRIDYSDEIAIASISQNYTANQRMLWSEDNVDKAYEDEKAANDIPFKKDFTLLSEYLKAGLTERKNPKFAATVQGWMQQIGNFAAEDIPRIWGSEEFVSSVYRYPAERPRTWLPRLFQYNGMVAFSGATNFDFVSLIESTSGTNYTTYPQMNTPDMADLYDDYWFNDFRRIDNNKIVTCTLKLTPAEITKFMTVVGTAANEGFRATYLLNIEGVDMYFICTKITTDGDRVKAEFIQKM